MIFLFSKKKEFSSWKIDRKVLKMILECSKKEHPKEFAGFLKAEKFVINELILIPGTISGNEGALLRLHMLPVDFGVVGTIHSHPTTSFLPSKPDKELFAKFGGVHLIVSYPYNEESWKAYNSKGEEVSFEIVDL